MRRCPDALCFGYRRWRSRSSDKEVQELQSWLRRDSSRSSRGSSRRFLSGLIQRNISRRYDENNGVEFAKGTITGSGQCHFVVCARLTKSVVHLAPKNTFWHEPARGNRGTSPHPETSKDLCKILRKLAVRSSYGCFARLGAVQPRVHAPKKEPRGVVEPGVPLRR